MVYRGRPSRDCLHCRRRKLRCDLQKTGCGQCKRASLVCTGYRSPDQLVIKDETPAVRQKALARACCDYPAVGSARAALQPGWDVRARQSFFSYYVFGLSRSYDMLVPLYEQEPSDGPLATSVDAVSLAFLSHQSGAPDLSTFAQERYTAAVHLLGRALRDPARMAADATLQAVLLLDLYEKIVNRNPRSSAFWMSHVNGAMSLIALRGQERTISSHVARRLATRLVNSLIISCWTTGIRVPPALDALRTGLALHMNPGEPKWTVTGEVIGLVNFRADLAEGKVTEKAMIIRTLQRLDARFVRVERALPSSWAARRVDVDTGREPLIFGSSYDVHRDHFVTQVRNVIRTMRLTIRTMISAHTGPDTPLGRAASDLIGRLTREMCASAPQFVLSAARPENRLPFAPLQALQCYTVITPLFHAGKVSREPALRCWVLAFLEHLAEAGGLRAAREVANILRDRPETSQGLVFAMLGSYAFAA